MDVLHPRCCGLDVHKSSISACRSVTYVSERTRFPMPGANESSTVE
jgi:hypothetical protein